LHFASFIGNIGDNANHSGLYKSLYSKIKGIDFLIEQEEIREYYWGKKFFDNKLIELFNQFDLIIVGGGNFFELWVENSRTGTSIDIPIEFLKKIKPSILFFSLGFDIHQGYSSKNKLKFSNFLDFLITDSKYLISMRNDGALNNLNLLYGNKYNSQVLAVPDSGIVLSPQDLNIYNGWIKGNTLGINLAGDMIDLRYSDNYDKALRVYSEFLKWIIEKYDYNIIFFPHIYSDYKISFDVLNLLPDSFKRKKVQIAPLASGNGGMKEIFSLYNQCKIIVANRFHSNLCSIALGKPTIGIVNYPQIENFYKEIGLSHYNVKINENNALENIKSIFSEVNKNQKNVVEEIISVRDQVRGIYNNSMVEITNWIQKKLK
jgi:polysaccharide pyruvyl transferase WcaK-like protein